MSIFDKSEKVKPYTYPHLIKYAHAIHESFWTPEHFTYDRDVNDFKINLSEKEQDIVKKAMLAIGFIENKVKTFYARIDMRLPKTEIAIVGHTIASNECFSDDTEILTTKGFKFLKDIGFKDEVAQYNLETKNITFINPTNIIKKQYTGKMHHYDGLGMDMLVTPKHDIITIHPTSRKRTKNKSENGTWSGNYRYPVSGFLQGGIKEELTPEERMLISLQADGTVFGCTPSGRECGRRDVSWNIYKKRKIERLESLLNSTGLPYKKKKRKGGGTVFSLRLPDWIDNDSIKNFGWVDISKVTVNYVEQFIEELSYWDCNRGKNSVIYYNTNEAAIDKVQSLATLGGYLAYKSINRTAEQSLKVSLPQGGSPAKSKTSFRLSLRERDERVYPKRKEVEYDGYVYCVSVPEQNIVTKRNGSVAIQGNCIHQLTYEKLLGLLNLDSEFEKIDEIPCMKGRSEYLSKYLKGVTSRSDKEFTKSLILFTLLVENASLFSQFLVVASFKKYRNLMSNFNAVIGATAREEDLHAKFGEDLIRIIRREFPEWFDDDMEKKIRGNVLKAYEAEREILNWIFEKGELEFLPKESIEEYLKDRFNKSLNKIGYKDEFEINESLLEPTEFLEVQMRASSSFDFFNEKSTEYSQNTAFDGDDMWS